MVDSTTIVLDPAVADLVREVVARGRHGTANEAIRSALEEYRARDDDRFGLSVQEIRRLWDAGIASGPGREPDFEAIKQEVHRRNAGKPER